MRCLAMAMLAIVLTGCGQQQAPSLEQFQQQWLAAVNERQPHLLYDMLDSTSRRQINQQLERLRGLPETLQQRVINYLGGERVSTLHEVTAAQFFGRLWRKATDDRLPTIKIEATGQTAAYMLIKLDDHTLRVELKIEAGRWTWSLPPQQLTPDLPAIAEQTNGDVKPG